MANTVRLKDYLGVYDEQVAAAAITPGMLCELTSTANTVQKHSTDSGIAIPLFALEDNLQGKGIDEDYSAADQVQLWYPSRGDEVYAILADKENVSRGDFLVSAGDGTLKKLTVNSAGAAEYPEAIVGQALEALNLSGSSGEESSGLQGNQRLQIRIV